MADLDIVKHLKYLNIGEKPEMISLRLHNIVFGDKVNKGRKRRNFSKWYFDYYSIKIRAKY